MCSSLLSMLERVMPLSEAERLADFLNGFTPNSAHTITASKAAQRLSMSIEEATKLLLSACSAGVLAADYGIRCPECNMLIKRIPSNEILPEENLICYSCEHEFEIDFDSIEVLYRITIPDFFPQGQHDSVSNACPVAPNDSLKALLATGCDLNSLFFSPSEAEYVELAKLYQSIFGQHRNTKEKGDKLETLVMYLFNLVHPFRAVGLKTKTNQIDCIVRNRLAASGGFFGFIGERIVIECKNEKKTPSGTYFHKICSILSMINNGAPHFMRFGIIVSKTAAPKTYSQLAYAFYMSAKTVIINMDSADLQQIIYERKNLLDVLERKRDEIAMQVSSDLRAIGFFE